MSALLSAAVLLASLVNGPATARTGDLLLFRSSEGVVPTALEFMGNRYPAVPVDSGEGAVYLLGVDLEAAGGSYPVTASLRDGSEVVAGAVTVTEGEYPTEELKLPPKMVTPPTETLERIAQEREAAAAVYRSSSPEILWRPPFTVPLDGKGSGNFGRRRILNGLPRSPHSGEDYSSPQGTPVRAVADGKVGMAANLYYSGNTVLLDHGGGLVSQYFHLHRLDVTAGQPVRRGDVIGTVGSTGRVTGAHLHFGVRLFSLRVDPSQLWGLFAAESEDRP